MKKYIFIVTVCIAAIAAKFYFFAQKHYNVVLISVDTLRADRLGCYGYEIAQTKNIDQLAKEGVLFEKCFAQAPLTFPSHISIMTGTDPTTHNVKDNLYYAFNKEKLPTMASILRAYKYQTAAVVSAAPLNRSKGLNKGFDLYSDVERISNRGKFVAERVGSDSVEIANKYLEEFSDDPFFLWLHLFDPHAEYKAPQRFTEMFTHPYDAEIAYTDYCIGLVIEKLKALGKYQNTIIVFVSDHGEGLGEHGELSHGYFTYNSTLHVPLIIKAPNIAPGKITFPVRTIDILPTVMNLLNKRNLSDNATEDGVCEGEDLSGYLKDKSLPPLKLECYGEAYYAYHTFGWRAMTSIVVDNFKFIDTKKGELYDINKDFAEKNNLCGDTKYQKVVERLKRLMISYQKSTGIPEDFNFIDENSAAIAANGYLLGSKPKLPPSKGPDPVEMKRVIKLITNAQTQMFLRRYHQAQELLYSILKEDPGNIMAQMLLGKLYSEIGQFKKSIAAFDEMEKLCEFSRFARNGKIDALIQLGNLDEALALITTTKNSGYAKSDPFLYSREAYIHIEKGAFLLAEKIAFQGINLKDKSQMASLSFYYARALQGQKKYHLASKEFAGAVKQKKYYAIAYYYWAKCLIDLNKISESKEKLKLALMHRPPLELRKKIVQLLQKISNK